MEVLAGAKKLLSACNVAAVIWEKGEFHERPIREERTNGIFDLLNAHGFQHFRFKDENQGGPLSPLQGNEGPCNVYSLAPDLARASSHA